MPGRKRRCESQLNSSASKRSLARQVNRALEDIDLIAEEEQNISFAENSVENTCDSRILDSTNDVSVEIDDESCLELESRSNEDEVLYSENDWDYRDFSSDEDAECVDIDLENEELAPCYSEETDDDQTTSTSSLRNQLAEWASKHKVEHVKINGLLSILRQHECHQDLPKDARTLLGTPRSVEVTVVHPGLYYHFGALEGLNRLLYSVQANLQSNFLDIFINIDGTPISESTGGQLWPILGLVRDVKGLEKEPFVIGIYYGEEKPMGPNTYLNKLVNELKDLKKNGFIYCNQTVYIRGCAFVCDAPARAFICGIQYPTGANCCSKCVTVGENAIKPSEERLQKRPKGRMVFTSMSSPLRSDESFRGRHHPNHHNYYTCLEELDIDMVRDFPLDPMHLIHEGACRKLFCTLLYDSDYKISPYNVKRVNQNMEKMSSYTPREFARKARAFDIKMKSTEWRQAALYTGPVVLLNRVSNERYCHFLSFHVAVKILSSKRFCTEYADYAHELLLSFVNNGRILYGKTFLTYNIHNLIHITNDVKIFGPLDTFSAYVFENKLGVIKRLLRKSEKPLQQLVKRIAENEKNKVLDVPSVKPEFKLLLEHNDGPVLPSFTDGVQFKQLKFEQFTLTTLTGDNCALLKENLCIIIENLVKINNDDVLIVGKSFELLENFYPEPFDSTMFNIYKCKQLSPDLQYWPIEDILFKMYLMPIPFSEHFSAYPLEEL